MSTAQRALLLGFVTGLRSALALALLAGRARPAVRRGLLLAAGGELVADKLPQTPNRIDPGPLGGRLVFGALAGGIVYRRAGRSVATGALLGAAGAAAGSYGGQAARAWLARATPLPDPVLALVEDAVAISLGRAALE